LRALPGLRLPHTPPGIVPAWHLFVLSHLERDRLQEYLKECGVGTLVHYPVPPHLSPAYQEMGHKSGTFPITEKIADTVLSIPMSPQLSLEDGSYIIEKIRAFCLKGR
jgi:dTDP-3-amino-3,4,6-trideoxy-alpha-D-glucose transaminase